MPSQVLEEAGAYVNGFEHGGFRAVLPWYVEAFKAGKTANDSLSGEEWPGGLGDGVVAAWYRTTPVKSYATRAVSLYYARSVDF